MFPSLPSKALKRFADKLVTGKESTDKETIGKEQQEVTPGCVLVL